MLLSAKQHFDKFNNNKTFSFKITSKSQFPEILHKKKIMKENRNMQKQLKMFTKD